MKFFANNLKIVVSLFSIINLVRCQTQLLFYYVTDLTNVDWKTNPVKFANDEHLIPNNYIAWSLYSNTINETGYLSTQ